MSFLDKHWRVELLTLDFKRVRSDTIHADWKDAYDELKEAQGMFPKQLYRVAEVKNEKVDDALVVDITTYKCAGC